MGNFEDFGEIAEILGVSRKTAAKYLRGERQPRADALQSLAWATGCDLHWLLTGDRSEGRAAETEALYRAVHPEANQAVLREIGVARADEDDIVIEFQDGAHDPLAGARLGLVRMEGNALGPLVRDGHHLLLDLQPAEPDDGDLAVVHLPDRLPALGRYFHADGEVLLQDVGPAAGKPLRLSENDIDHAHVVLGILFH